MGKMVQLNFFAVIFSIALTVTKCSPALNEMLNNADHYFNRRQYAEALSYFENALTLNPNEPYAMQGAASCLSEMGRFREAGYYFESAARTSGMFQFLMNAGMAYHNSGDFEAAIRLYESCIQANPQFRPCHLKIAGLYNQLGRFMDVQTHLHAAISLDPAQYEAYMYLGDVYNNLRQFSLAIDTYKEAFKLKGPHKLQALASIGDAHTNLKDYSSARKYYDMILKGGTSSVPTDIQVSSLFNQLQIGLWKGFELAFYDSWKANEKGLARNEVSALSPYRCLFLPVPPQDELTIARSWAMAFMESTRFQHTPESSVPVDSNKCNRDGVTSTADDIAVCRSLKAGYISRRFEDYPGTQMMLRLFEAHNRSLVKVHTYAHGPDDSSPYREHIAATSDVFVDISSLDTAAANAMVQGDRLDILIDYDGMHDFNSVKLLLSRPAKIQATWLGFAGTTGFRQNEGVDYALVDRIIAPPDIFGAYYSEKLIYLPDGYQPQDEYQGDAAHFKRREETDIQVAAVAGHTGAEVAGSDEQRDMFAGADVWYSAGRKVEARKDILHRFWQHAGRDVLDKLGTEGRNGKLISEQKSHDDEKRTVFNIRNDGYDDDNLSLLAKSFWFICFNRMEKITPDVFYDWILILQRTTHVSTVLLLMSHSVDVDYNILRNAASSGVASSRIVFLKHMPKEYYLRTLAISDVFLDTAYYGAHTTASDALFGATPVLTVPKHTVSSRVASSLNIAAGVDILNVVSRKEYVDMAVQLARRRGLLREIRSKIRKNLGKVLFNSSAFARKLERTYTVMYDLYPDFKHIYAVGAVSQRHYDVST